MNEMVDSTEAADVNYDDCLTLLGRWWRKPTLPGSRVTRRAQRLATLAWWEWRSRKKIYLYFKRILEHKHKQ